MNEIASIKNPLKLRISHQGTEILTDKNFKDNLPLNPGALIGSEHYGFTIIVDYAGIQSENTYPTQYRIIALGIKDKNLAIYEEHKYKPWIIDNKGIIMEKAEFLNYSRKDRDFIAEKYDLHSEAEVELTIEQVNSYELKKKPNN